MSLLCLRRAETHNPEVFCEVFPPGPRPATGGADEVSSSLCDIAYLRPNSVLIFRLAMKRAFVYSVSV